MKELSIARRADFYKVIVKVMAMACALFWTTFAQADLNSFSYEGRLFDNAGNPLNAANVSIRVEIFSATGGCLLYQETHAALNLSSSITHEQGVFSIKVGTGTRSGTDPGLTFADIFKNSNALTGASCSYTPVATDIRHLRVHVDSGGGYEVLSPDFDILSAPGTMVAQSLQGKAANEFLQVVGTVNQANLAALVGGGDVSALHHHDSRYLQIGSAAAQNLGSGTLYTTGQVGIGTIAPTAGVELHVRDAAAVATVKIEGAAASGSKIIFNDAAIERAAINTEGGTSSLVISTGGVTALRIDADQNTVLSGSLFMNGIMRTGQVSGPAIETVMTSDLSTSCGAGCSGGTWYRTDSGQFRIWDNTRGTRSFATYQNTPNTNDVLQWDGVNWNPAAMTMNDATKLPLAGGTITGSLTVAGSIAAGSIGTGPIAATSLISNSVTTGTILANNITVSISPASALDVVNKDYADTRLAGRTIVAPVVGNDGQSVRWNNTAASWQYFNSLATGNAANLVTANSDVPNCLSSEKLQMSAGPFYSYSCAMDNSTDPTKLPVAGGAITGALTVTGAFVAQAAVNANQIDANSMTISLSPAGNLNATNKVYVDTHVANRSIASMPAVGQDGQSLRWNNTTSTWEYFTAGVAGVGVLSFNGRVGAVNSQANDYTWAQVDKTTSSLADLTTRSAGDLSSGTLNDLRLSSNVTRNNTANVFSVGNQRINIEASANKGLIVRGFAGQTALLTDWQDNVGTTLYGINPTGVPTTATDLTTKNYVDSRQSITSLGGLTNATQVLAVDTATGTAPSWVSNGGTSTHTLRVPMANVAGVTAGLISKTDYDAFTAKQAALGYAPVNRTGDTMTGALSMGTTNKITNLAVPTVGTDAANKIYVDNTVTAAVHGGDATGFIGAITVVGLRNIPLSATAPTSGEYLRFVAGSWQPAALAIPASSIGTAEISNETIQSSDILDGTITNSDISASAAITISKISGYGNMCLQNQGNVTITGGIANLGRLTISGSSGDILDITTASGGGLKLQSIGASSYIDLIDVTGAYGTLEMDGNSILKLHNQQSGFGQLELGAGNNMTTVRLLASQNKMDMNAAVIANLGNPTISGDAVNLASDMSSENEPILSYVGASLNLVIKGKKTGFRPVFRMPSGEVFRAGAVSVPVTLSSTTGWHFIYMVRRTDNLYVAVDGGTSNWPQAGLPAASLTTLGAEWRYLGAVYVNGTVVNKFMYDGDTMLVSGLPTTGYVTGSVIPSTNTFPRTAKMLVLEASMINVTASCIQVVSYNGDSAFPPLNVYAYSGAGLPGGVVTTLRVPMDASSFNPIVNINPVSGACGATAAQKYLGYVDGYL